MAAKRYVLVEWESDSSVSVVPASRLKTRKGNRVKQAWPGGVFTGTVLKESDSKKELDARAKELVRVASPKKSPKKNGAKPKTKTPKKRKPTSQGAKGTPSKRKPSNSSTPKPKITEKARQKLADIEKAKEDAQWLFGSDSRSDSDRDTDSLDETDIEDPTDDSNYKSVYHRGSPQKSSSRGCARSLSVDYRSSSAHEFHSPSTVHRAATFPYSGGHGYTTPAGPSFPRTSTDVGSSRTFSGPSQHSVAGSFDHEYGLGHTPPGQSHADAFNDGCGLSPGRTSNAVNDQRPARQSISTPSPSPQPPRSSSGRTHSRQSFSPTLSERSFSPSSTLSYHHGQRSNSGGNSGVNIRVEEPRLVELVEGLGVFVPAHQLLGCIRNAKKSPSSLMRQLMGVVFSDEEMQRCSVRGRGNRPALPAQKLEAIIGYVLSKHPNERTEYLIRQANDKLNRVRARGQSKN